MNNIEEKLKEIDTENFIWVIYIGIIILSYYSNYLEKNYFLYHDIKSKQEYRKIIIFIFSVLIIVYFYFLNSSLDDVRNITPNDPRYKNNLIMLSFIGSLLIFISGLIFLYIAFKDENLDVELAFN